MESNRRESASSGALYQYFSQATSLLSGLIFYAYIMHSLTSAFVGEVVLISTLVQIFASIFSLQLQNGFMHFLSYNMDDEDYRNGLARKFLGITLLLSLISYPLFYYSAPLFSGILFHSPADSLIRFSSIYLSISVGAGLVSGIAYGLQWFKKVNILRTITAIAGYLIAAVVAVSLHSIVSVIIALSMGQLSFIVSLLYRNPAFSRPASSGTSKLEVRQLFSYSLPLILTVFVGNSANHLDKLVTAAFMSVSSVGVYNLALMVATGLFGSTQSINQILLPKMSEIYARNGPEVLGEVHGTAVRIIAAFYIPASVGLIAISSQVVSIVGGAGYNMASLPMELILFVTAVCAPLMVTSIIPSAIRKTKISYIIAPVSFLTNLGLSLLLIPKFGIMGAAIGFAALYPVRFMIVYLYSRRWMKLEFGFLPLTKIWISSIAMFIFLRVVEMFSGHAVFSVIYLIPLGSAIYIVLLRVSKALRRGDFSLILEVIPERYDGIRKTLYRILTG